MDYLWPLQFFVDPIFRAPTWGTLLMGLSSGLIGVILFLQKHTLIGEVLSHATFPGMLLGVCLFSLFGLSGSLLLGALLFGWLGVFVVRYLQKRLRVSSDAAQCVTLAVFMGFGVLLASRLQFTHPVVYQKIQMFLYGQAATMQDAHIVWYVLFAVCVISYLVIFFPSLRVMYFDATYARVVGVAEKRLQEVFKVLLLLAVVLGVQSVGVLLMVGMFIAPAVTARQYSDRLAVVFMLAGAVGALSGLMGMFFSVNGSLWLTHKLHKSIMLPTGPIIMLCASFMTLFTLLFSPKRGFCVRLYRRCCFQTRCIGENILKCLYKQKGMQTLAGIQDHLGSGSMVLRYMLWSLRRQGFVQNYQLTEQGKQRARHIIRLHRLWEVYLVREHKIDPTLVHTKAEEMEHIITPELEQELDQILQSPATDPHDQHIPQPHEVS